MIILTRIRNISYILKGMLAVSILLAFLLLFLNISKPYISYNLFYDKVKSFSFPLSSIPQSFFTKARDEQYFNSRYYWYFPYKSIVEILSNQNLVKNNTVAFDLPDGFEYPIWVLIKKNNLNIQIVPLSKISYTTIIISTSKEPYMKKGYISQCIKTDIEYGYACLSKQN